MPKIMQNVVFFKDPTGSENDISLKAGNMNLNRFCIDEDASFEISGMSNLNKRSNQGNDGYS